MELYFWLSALVTLWCSLRIPSRLDRAHDALGSMIIAVAFGWLIWPFVALAAWKAR